MILALLLAAVPTVSLASPLAAPTPEEGCRTSGSTGEPASAGC